MSGPHTGKLCFVSQFLPIFPTCLAPPSLCPPTNPKPHISSVLLPDNHNRRLLLQSLAAVVPLSLIPPAFADQTPISDIDPAVSEPQITDRVYLDISLDGGALTRLTIGLYGLIAPITVENFKQLLKNGYAGTAVYRIVPGLTVQMGDVLHNGGKSGHAANSNSFQEENFRVMHSIPGIVSMVHDQKGMVDSRFFVNTRPGDSGYLDGKYCAFGRVLNNLNFLYEVEHAAERRGGFVSRLPKVIIERCGTLS